MLIALLACSLVGALLGYLTGRMSRVASVLLTVVLLAAYLIATFTLEPGSSGMRLVSAGTVGYAIATLVYLVRTEIPASLARRRRVDEAEAAIREQNRVP